MLITNIIKFNIDEKSDIPFCRLCWISTETMGHISNECYKLAREENRKKYDKIALWVHRKISKKCGLEASSHKEWMSKAIWDIAIYTD